MFTVQKSQNDGNNIKEMRSDTFPDITIIKEKKSLKINPNQFTYLENLQENKNTSTYLSDFKNLVINSGIQTPEYTTLLYSKNLIFFSKELI